jgi:hypothetical protein
MALPLTLKSILQGKRRILWKLKYFTTQKYNLQKNPLKETNLILQAIIITLELISNFNTSQNISSFKNPHIKIDLLLLPSMGL